MIGLQQQALAAPITIDDMGSDATQVSQHSEADACGSKDILHRLPRIVGHGNGLHIETADNDALTAADDMQRILMPQLRGPGGTGGHVDR